MFEIKRAQIILLIAFAVFGGRREIWIKPSESAIVMLPDSNIVDGSDSLFCGEDLVDSDLYSFDYFSGAIDFQTHTCESVRVVYLFVDFGSMLVQHRAMRGSEALLLHRQPRRYMGISPESRLTHSGSLLRGIKLGTRSDPTIQSAFQLEAFGDIGEGVEIKASLSDQDLPIQPEGTSEKIAQLDQVYISVLGPFFGATFGDFPVNFSESSEFTKYSRRLAGVQIKAFSDEAAVEGVGAILDGIWASSSFEAREGIQGPYQISVGGKSFVQILAGTETVCLDGEKMRRGSDNDYTIDYNLGQLTFTAQRPVGAGNRIYIEFQYTDLDYRRGFYGASGKLVPTERLAFYFSGIMENDDPDNPLAGEIDEAGRAALANAGDNPDSAFVINAYLSDSGAYFLADSATDSAHFVWIGEGFGNWNVGWTYVGERKGDYDAMGAGVFQWVGRGEGAYLPIKLLPLPGSHNVLGLRVEASPFDGVSISTELAASNLDRNRLSTRDDGDNSGGAYKIALASKKKIELWGKNYGALSLDAKFRRKENKFETIGQLDAAEFGRDWGLEGASGGEKLAEAEIKYSPNEAITLGSSFGTNELGNAKSERITATASLATGAAKGAANYSRTKSDAEWHRAWGDISGNIGIITPSLSGRFEQKRSANGFRFWQSAASVAVAPSKWLTLKPGIERREDELLDLFASTPSSRTTALKFDANAGNWNFLYYHREFEALMPGANDVKSDIAKIEGTVRSPKREFDGRLRYSLSNERSEVLEPVYTFVGSGRGNYEFDEDRGEFVWASSGDYIQEFRPTGEFTPVVGSDASVGANIGLGWLPGNSAIARLAKSLSFVGMVRAESKTEEESANSLILSPGGMFEDSSILLGQFSAEGAVHFGRQSSSGISLKRRYRRSLNAQLTTGKELRYSSQYSVEGRYAIREIGNLRANVEFSADLRQYPGTSRAGADITGIETIFTWGKQLSGAFQASVDVGFQAQRDEEPSEPIRTKRYSISPTGTYFIKGGNATCGVEYSRVEAGDFSGILDYEMARGDFPGDNGKINATIMFNLTNATLVSVSYRLVSRTNRFPEHTAEANIRLSF